MEIYRQPIRIYDKHVTMLGMVSDLTGLVRRYYGNWQRPLAKNREDLQNAKQLGDRIIGIASQRPWREAALQDVLEALEIQDRQMHQRVVHILTDVRVVREIAAHQALHNELREAFDQENTTTIWQTSRALYKLSNQTRAFLDSDSSHADTFYGRMAEVRKEDPSMYTRIVYTLDVVGPSRTKTEIPRPRTPPNEIEVYRSPNAGRFRI